MELYLPIGGGALVMALVAFAGKQMYNALKNKFEEYDKHLEECNAKAVQHARFEEKVLALSVKVIEVDHKCGRMEEKLDRLLERK